MIEFHALRYWFRLLQQEAANNPICQELNFIRLLECFSSSILIKLFKMYIFGCVKTGDIL